MTTAINAAFCNEPALERCHDQRTSLYAKRLERGQFAWPSASTTGRIQLSAPQLAALLDGCEWRAPAPPRRPELAG